MFAEITFTEEFASLYCNSERIDEVEVSHRYTESLRCYRLSTVQSCCLYSVMQLELSRLFNPRLLPRECERKMENDGFVDSNSRPRLIENRNDSIQRRKKFVKIL